MSNIERPRFSCMLGGVLATLSAMPRTIPIIHGAQGCGGNLASVFSLGGYLGAGYCGNTAVPSSNIGESDIIFGGGDRLIREINSTFEVMDGDLFVVTTTCMTDIIGDDIKGILNEVGDKDKPILFVDAGGFKGNSYYGYSVLMQELFVQYIPKSEKKNKKLVNILGLVPGYDPYFRGDLEEVQRILGLLGIEATTFFTHDQTQEKIKRAGEAALNIVFSRLYGTSAAETAKETHGIDYWVTELPIGSVATVKFIRELAQKLELDQALVDAVIEKETDSYYKYIDRATDLIADTDFQNYAIVIANGTEALAYAKYLDGEIGWVVNYIFVTDELTDEQKAVIWEAFEEIEFAQRPKLVFETDTYSIQQTIGREDPQFKLDRYYEKISPAFVLGSTIDKKLATVLNGFLLSISFPVINRIIVSRGYAGFRGGLSLLEDLIGAQIAGR